MRKAALMAAVTAFVNTGAYAEPVKPGDVKYKDGAVAASLSGAKGDAAKGKKWFVGRKLGNCLACHENSDAKNQSFHGEVGPPLDGVADRYTEAELRGIVANAKMTFEDTIMPAFYKDSGFFRPRKDFKGKSILTAQQVEDIVAYLRTLKED